MLVVIIIIFLVIVFSFILFMPDSNRENDVQDKSSSSGFETHRAERGNDYKAAKAGNYDAMYSLSLEYRYSDKAAAFEWAKKAAESGRTDYLYYLAYTYYADVTCMHGKYFNAKKAIECYNKILKNRDKKFFSQAAAGLGYIYSHQVIPSAEKMAESNRFVMEANPYYNPQKAAYSFIVAHNSMDEELDFYKSRQYIKKANECMNDIPDKDLRSWANDGRNLRYNFNI